jgi:hypothetical protein
MQPDERQTVQGGEDNEGGALEYMRVKSGAERGDQAWTTRLGRRILFDCSGAIGPWYSVQER